ncbi:MAG: hypothetical protein K2X64_07545, partial [Rhodocyclaceae bacterium]|nr:hypothetical protein [Rhodocyclaceae bacterium]
AADAVAESRAFEQNFLAACAKPDAAKPPQIPAYRLFTPYAAEGEMSGYYLNPFASEAAFPPSISKGLFGKKSIREAALECCDVQVSKDGLVTAVAIDSNPLAIIHNDGRSLSIKPISADKDIMAMSFTSAGAVSPFKLDIQNVSALTKRFRDARSKAGETVHQMMQRPLSPTYYAERRKLVFGS